MILFYSEYCKHCNILLETIKKHDKNNTIKLVSIDVLRSLKKPIDPKIHSVPALMILNTKEYLFGKSVFDYLLLPNRGILFSGQTTREDKKLKDSKELNNIPSINSKENPNEPLAFTLGSISSESFSTIDDTNEMINDKNYKWDLITDNEQTMKPPEIQQNDKDSGSKKNLPSMEEIMKKRANDIL